MEEQNKIEQPDADTLKLWLDKAINDNKQLMSRLHQVTDALNILPYLFKIVEYKAEFDESLVNSSKNAIANIIFPPVEDGINESKEE